jgi:hypothetical protein
VGLFSKIGNSVNQAFGGADAEVMRSGTSGLGQIMSAQPTGGTIQVGGGLVERTCTFQVKVLLDGGSPYVAVVRQRVPEVYLAQLQSGNARVAVRVDPVDPQRVVLDLSTQPPSVQLARNSGPNSAEHILNTGTEAIVVMVESSASGYRDWRGYDLYDFLLTVIPEVGQPYQVRAGNAVPAESLPLLYPGSRLHAKVGDEPTKVVVDFSQGAAGA